MDRRTAHLHPATLFLLALSPLACGASTELEDPAPPTPPAAAPTPITTIDLLLAVDDSISSYLGQQNFSAALPGLLAGLSNAGATSLHVGVISTDLGTPGALVPSCSNSDLGDDGILNPIHNGLSMQQHEPWMTLAPGTQPPQCTSDPNQYPSFLSYDPNHLSTAGVDIVCNAQLGSQGCGVPAQMESIYRALVLHNPRATAGNTDANAGFLRDDALLSIVLMTDHDDESVRDCRYAEAGQPCQDATSVYDSENTSWASSDLALRFYLATPGGALDPTWNLDRYIDPSNTSRGLLGLKPGHPERVIFSAIAGVPLNLPTLANGRTDYATLLGGAADGSQGWTGNSTEGPVSMRAVNPDPLCPLRVVPGCREQGSTYDTQNSASCYDANQWVAWPARRIAEVSRRFAQVSGNTTLSSVCQGDMSGAVSGIVQAISARMAATP